MMIDSPHKILKIYFHSETKSQAVGVRIRVLLWFILVVKNISTVSLKLGEGLYSPRPLGGKHSVGLTVVCATNPSYARWHFTRSGLFRTGLFGRWSSHPSTRDSNVQQFHFPSRPIKSDTGSCSISPSFFILLQMIPDFRRRHEEKAREAPTSSLPYKITFSNTLYTLYTTYCCCTSNGRV